jgi:hypothetical protein
MSPAPQIRPRVAADDFLTETDRLLLVREFNSPDPESIPGLLDTLPPDARVLDILSRYDVTPEGGMRNRHKRPFLHCAHCRGARHWRGFVIQLDDANESLALIGEDCGEKQFGLDFRRVESDFNAERGRQADLRRLMEIREQIPAFEQELDALRKSAVMHDFDTYMAGLSRFGKLRFVLRETAQRNDGVLTCVSHHRDHDAEERHAKTLPLYKHHSERIAGAQTEYIRRTRMEERQQWLDTLPSVEYSKTETLGRFVGGEIFEANGSIAAGMRAARDMLATLAGEFMCDRSDYWTARGITASVKKMGEGIGLVYRALRMLAELDKFTAAENLATIAKWSQREVELPQPRIEFSVKASGRTLIDEDDRFRLSLASNWALPTTPHMNALAHALGEVTSD